MDIARFERVDGELEQAVGELEQADGELERVVGELVWLVLQQLLNRLLGLPLATSPVGIRGIAMFDGHQLMDIGANCQRMMYQHHVYTTVHRL